MNKYQRAALSKSKEADGVSQEGAKQKISSFAVRIFNLTRSNDFVKGQISKIFPMRHFWYKVANFSKFFENRCKICRTLSHSKREDKEKARGGNEMSLIVAILAFLAGFASKLKR